MLVKLVVLSIYQIYYLGCFMRVPGLSLTVSGIIWSVQLEDKKISGFVFWEDKKKLVDLAAVLSDFSIAWYVNSGFGICFICD